MAAPEPPSWFQENEFRKQLLLKLDGIGSNTEKALGNQDKLLKAVMALVSMIAGDLALRFVHTDPLEYVLMFALAASTTFTGFALVRGRKSMHWSLRGLLGSLIGAFSTFVLAFAQIIPAGIVFVTFDAFVLLMSLFAFAYAWTIGPPKK